MKTYFTVALSMLAGASLGAGAIQGLQAQGKPKAWGLRFQELAAGFKGKRIDPPNIGGRPKLDWDACLTSSKAG